MSELEDARLSRYLFMRLAAVSLLLITGVGEARVRAEKDRKKLAVKNFMM